MKNPVLLLALLMNCNGSNFGQMSKDTTPTLPKSASGPETTTNTSDTSVVTEPVPIGNISGEVNVSLYSLNSEGEREEISWKKVCGDAEFPFGAIYVTAYADELNYRGEDTILRPLINSNFYEIIVNLNNDSFIQVYASLDYNNDGIIHTFDPIGVYPHALEMSEGDEIDNINIDILVEYNGCDSSYYGSSSGVGGIGGGTGETTWESWTTIAGSATIDEDLGSMGMAMLTTTEGVGPLYWDWFIPDGKTGNYEITAPTNYGEVKLIGAYDCNLNGLIDPSDKWGAYVVEANVEGNPINIGENSMNDMWIQIPIGEGSNELEIIPFTSVTGVVGVAGGTFDDLPEGSTVHVAALKYRPTSDLSLTSFISNAFDYNSFEWPELSGNTNVAFSLGVPANSIVYMWAYADTDGDGIVNESGEPIASGGEDSAGTLNTNSKSLVQTLYLGQAE